MLPFDLPSVSRGFAELGPGLEEVGREVAAAIGRALAGVLGIEVEIAGRALPGEVAGPGPCARLGIDLPALPGAAVLEVDAASVVSVADHLAGAPGEAKGARAPTPVEISALELVVLAALDAAAGVEPVERTLSPRLARRCQEPESPLCLALELRAGGERGRARLLLPPSAVRALRAPPAFPEALCRFPVPCSLRSGRASPDAGELEALRPGDVLVLDAAGEPDALVLPGGGRIRGRIAGDGFRVGEVP